MNLRTHITPAIGRIATVLTAAAAIAAVPATAHAAPAASGAAAAPKPAVRLWVDPGHGGKDPGAVAGGLLEKDSALQVSKLVIQSAKRQGWEVGASRSDDTFVPLTTRPARANSWNADAFVSVHSNSAGDRPLGHMTINRNVASKNLGDSIMRELDPLTPYEDLGNRPDSRGLAVLRGAEMPAVIVELLSVSSSAERPQLKSKWAQERMAEAIVKGVAANKGVPYTPPAAPAAPKAEAPKAEPTVTPAAAPKADAKPKAEPKPAATSEPRAATDATPKAKTERAEEPKPTVNKSDAVEEITPLTRLGAMLRGLFR